MRCIDAQGRLFGKVSLVDMTIACFVLSLTPIFPYLYGSAFERWRMMIDHVSPERITAGVDWELTILGNGFDVNSTVRLGQRPPLDPKFVSFINESRLVAKIPNDIEPGWHHLSVRNGRGRLVVKEGAFSVIWIPEITQVVPSGVVAGARAVLDLDVYGRYFEPGCRVSLGAFHAEAVQYLDSTHLHMMIPSNRLRVGSLKMIVTNPTGETQAILADAVRVSPMAEAVSVAPSPPQ